MVAQALFRGQGWVLICPFCTTALSGEKTLFKPREVQPPRLHAIQGSLYGQRALQVSLLGRHNSVDFFVNRNRSQNLCSLLPRIRQRAKLFLIVAGHSGRREGILPQRTSLNPPVLQFIGYYVVCLGYEKCVCVSAKILIVLPLDRLALFKWDFSFRLWNWRQVNRVYRLPALRLSLLYGAQSEFWLDIVTQIVAGTSLTFGFLQIFLVEIFNPRDQTVMLKVQISKAWLCLLIHHLLNLVIFVSRIQHLGRFRKHTLHPRQR